MSEGEPKLERESGVSKIVGATPEEEQVGRGDIKELFDNPRGREILIGEKRFSLEAIEREKTPEEKEVIAGILEKMPEFVKRYGGTPVNVSENHIHIVDANKLDEESRKIIEQRVAGGEYNNQQYIIIYPGTLKAENILGFAGLVTHEIIHFNSFQSVEKAQGAGNIKLETRRFGLSMRDRKKGAFTLDRMNEAVTEELTILFDKNYFPEIAVLQEEILRREEAKKTFLKKYPYAIERAESVLFVIGNPHDFDGIRVGAYSYRKDRKELNEIIDDLYAENKDTLKSREKVFNVFAGAAMSGSLLPLARLVEKTYGKGSFRRLDEMSKVKKGK